MSVIEWPLCVLWLLSSRDDQCGVVLMSFGAQLVPVSACFVAICLHKQLFLAFSLTTENVVGSHDLGTTPPFPDGDVADAAALTQHRRAPAVPKRGFSEQTPRRLRVATFTHPTKERATENDSVDVQTSG